MSIKDKIKTFNEYFLAFISHMGMNFHLSLILYTFFISNEDIKQEDKRFFLIVFGFICLIIFIECLSIISFYNSNNLNQSSYFEKTKKNKNRKIMVSKYISCFKIFI